MVLTARSFSVNGQTSLGSNAATNVNQGGGPNKAGLVPMKNITYLRPIALKTAQTRNTLPNMGNPVIFGLQHTVNPNVSASRPVGTKGSVPYWNFLGL